MRREIPLAITQSLSTSIQVGIRDMLAEVMLNAVEAKLGDHIEVAWAMQAVMGGLVEFLLRGGMADTLIREQTIAALDHVLPQLVLGLAAEKMGAASGSMDTRQ